MNTDNLQQSDLTIADAKLITIWRLAWPSITSNFLATIIGIFHLKIISSWGPVAVSAIVTGHRYFFLLQAMIIALSISASALIAHSWGARKSAQANQMATTAMICSAVITRILSLPGLIFPMAIAGAFGLALDVTVQAAIFIKWLSIFSIIASLNIMLSTILRATGDTITPLYLSAFSTIANISFATIFALGLFGLEPMGINGLGLGSGIGMTLTTGFFLYLWFKGHFSLKISFGNALDRQQLQRLITLAIPIAVEQGLIQFSLLAFMAIVALYGTNAYAAYGIGLTLLSLSFVIGIGFGIASSTIIGQLLGAKLPSQARASGWKSMWLALICMSVLAILMALFSEQLAMIMSNNKEVIELSSRFIKILAFAQPIMAIEFSLAGALRGAGDTRFPLLSTFSGLLFGRLLMALLFVYWGLNIYWIFSVALIDFSIKAALLAWRFHSGLWLDKHRKIAAQ